MSRATVTGKTASRTTVTEPNTQAGLPPLLVLLKFYALQRGVWLCALTCVVVCSLIWPLGAWAVRLPRSGQVPLLPIQILVMLSIVAGWASVSYGVTSLRENAQWERGFPLALRTRTIAKFIIATLLGVLPIVVSVGAAGLALQERGQAAFGVSSPAIASLGAWVVCAALALHWPENPELEPRSIVGRAKRWGKFIGCVALLPLLLVWPFFLAAIAVSMAAGAQLCFGAMPADEPMFSYLPARRMRLYRSSKPYGIRQLLGERGFQMTGLLLGVLGGGLLAFGDRILFTSVGFGGFLNFLMTSDGSMLSARRTLVFPVDPQRSFRALVLFLILLCCGLALGGFTVGAVLERTTERSDLGRSLHRLEIDTPEERRSARGIPHSWWRFSVKAQPSLRGLDGGTFPSSQMRTWGPLTMYNPYEIPDGSSPEFVNLQLGRILHDQFEVQEEPHDIAHQLAATKTLSGVTLGKRLALYFEHYRSIGSPFNWRELQLGIFFTAFLMASLWFLIVVRRLKNSEAFRSPPPRSMLLHWLKKWVRRSCGGLVFLGVLARVLWELLNELNGEAVPFLMLLNLAKRTLQDHTLACVLFGLALTVGGMRWVSRKFDTCDFSGPVPWVLRLGVIEERSKLPL